MEQLQVERHFTGPPPNYCQPKEVGIFSLTSKGFFNDDRNLKYYIEPRDKERVRFDLNKGYPEKLVPWKGEGGDLDHILKWIREAKKTNPNILSGVDFVTMRGHLTKVTCSPYDRADEWRKLAVSKFKGKWYVSQVRDDWEEDLKMTYWGHKFEQYLTADTPGGAPDTDAVIDLNDGFYTVVKSRLNTHSLLFSGEVDGRVTGSTKACYVEMKTNRALQHPKQQANFYKYKLRKCWAQSYLVGVPEIVFGFRDDGGVVKRVKSFRTDEIPGQVAQYDHSWSKDVCMNFCDRFLTYVKRCATKDDPNVVYLFQREGQRVRCTESGNPRDKFLPAWYTSAV